MNRFSVTTPYSTPDALFHELSSAQFSHYYDNDQSAKTYVFYQKGESFIEEDMEQLKLHLSLCQEKNWSYKVKNFGSGIRNFCLGRLITTGTLIFSVVAIMIFH